MRSILALAALFVSTAAAAFSPSGIFIDSNCVDASGNEFGAGMSTDCTLGTNYACTLIFNTPNNPPYTLVSEILVMETDGDDATLNAAHPEPTADSLEPVGTAVTLCVSSCDSGNHDPSRMKFTATADNGTGAFNEAPASDELALDSARYWAALGGAFRGSGDTIHFTFTQTRLGWVHVRVNYTCGSYDDHVDFTVKVHA